MGSVGNGESLPLAAYLWHRVRQLGVQSVMGVPGDMNLELLDYIDAVDGLKWVGNANELNAAYAADAYCRVKGCSGVLVTTMGVGELSALNGVAGAYTEYVKLIHIVGTTSTKAQKDRAMIHHCLGPNPDHRVYSRMSEPIRTAHCWLDNTETAPAEIDRILRECYVSSLPVYIFVPMDIVKAMVPTTRLHKSLELEPRTDSAACLSAVDAVVKRIEMAHSPVIIVDALVARFGAATVVRQLLDETRIPVFATPMGKSIVDETKPYYHGIYNGSISLPGVARVIEKTSDLVIDLGPCHSDSNTGGHSRNITKGEDYVMVTANHVTIGHATYRNIYMKDFLAHLSEKLVALYPLHSLSWDVQLAPSSAIPVGDDGSITQSWIWKRIGAMTRPGDIVLGESGTAQFGFSDSRFAADVQYITQIYFGSIGYSVPACFGAAIAQAESGCEGGRTILVVGDGALQLTVQEIGTMIRHGLRNIIIMVINNQGYTIERAIHGPDQGYNDIATWNHQLLLSAFGEDKDEVNSHRVTTKADFEKVVSSSAFTDMNSIQLVEIMMDKYDIPWQLKQQIDLINARNAKAGSCKEDVQ
ncbi:thiamine diphosphate-binding protein [Aspergillus ambiguus]|uniref:alpha-keto acid decarboxylase family protein n=1 Tax=Aspergillus ambiguus TaxID=176160 RepID=UPI003CCE4D75